MLQSTMLFPSSPLEAEARQRLTALQTWLVNDALPLWYEQGVDWRRGGFHEKLALDGGPIDEPRRTRVTARQIYVFTVAARLGWHREGLEAAGHGLTFLHDRLRRTDGTYACAVYPNGETATSGFDLYEQAFALYGLAHAYRAGLQPSLCEQDALALLATLRARYAHPRAGFEEANPPRTPLLSNPHMHLFEACLAWAESGASPAPWLVLADELAELCLTRFIAPDTGAIREEFDAEWRTGPSPESQRVEPGHQFEWAWLLHRWADLRASEQGQAARAAATRLMALGERHGIDGLRGVAINSLRGDLGVLDPKAKLWPQTERLKAWCDLVRRGLVSAQDGWLRLDHAARALQLFLTTEPRGLWREVLQADGRFVREPVRASSLYHVVCALEAAHALVPLSGSFAGRR